MMKKNDEKVRLRNKVEKIVNLAKKSNGIDALREKMANNALVLLNGMAERNGVEKESLAFYDSTYAAYIADYVKSIFYNKKMTNEQALDVANKDLIKQLQGGLLRSSKDYNASNAYKEFVDICFYIQSRIAKKYGVETYYDIESSGNVEAIQEQKKFEEWKESRTKILENATKMNRDEMINFYSNPKEMIGSVGMARKSKGGGEPKRYMTEDERKPGRDFAGICILLIVWVSVEYVVFDICIDKYADELDAIARDLGFSDYKDLYNYLDEVGYKFLSDEEKNVIIESWLNESNELVANNYGFDSFEDALDTIGEKKEITTNIEEYNANIIEQKNISLDKMANYWGFDSIEGVEQYFAIKTGSNQDDINALSPQDRVIKESFENIYNYFNGQIKTPEASFQGEIISDETLNHLNNELIANEIVLKSVYEGFFEDHDKYFYANNLNAQMIGDNLLDSVGGEDIPSAEKSSLWDRLLDIMPAMNNSMGGTGGNVNFPDDIATEVVGAGVGALAGATIVTAVKGRKVIATMREMKKYKKFDEIQTAISIEKESEVDYNASGIRGN